MSVFETSLEEYCLLNNQGECIENVQGTHTKIGIKRVSRCRICGGDKWKIINHPPVIRGRDTALRQPLGHRLLQLDPPDLTIPTAEDIIADNEFLRDIENGDSLYD